MELEQAIELWFHYEEIAMHFNELIIQYRLQVMGGAGAIGAVASYLVGSKVESISMRHTLRAYISTGLFILFAAAAFLDIYYYNELLRGAVASIIQLEEQYKELNMSSTIKAQFDSNGIGARERIYITYALVMIPLGSFMVWTWCTCRKTKPSSTKSKLGRQD